PERKATVLASVTPRYRATRALLQARWPKIRNLHGLFNFAGDLEINDDVEQAGWKWPPNWPPLIPQEEGFPAGQTMERYVDLMLSWAEQELEKQRTEQDDQPQRGQEGDDSDDDGEGEPGDGATGNSSGGPTDQDDEADGDDRAD